MAERQGSDAHLTRHSRQRRLAHVGTLVTGDDGGADRVQVTEAVAEQEDASEAAAGPSPRSSWSLWSPLDRDVVVNALAAAGASVADPLMSLVDTAFVARLGTVHLASLGPNAALYNMIFFISFMAMAVVTTDQMASANSKGDVRGVGRAFFTSATTSLLVGLVCCAAIVAFPEAILRGFFQVNDEMMGPAKVYAVIRALSIPASLMMVTCQAAFRALLDLRTPLLVVIAAGFVNLVLDPLMMFNMGMGMAGAAWATTISQYIGAVAFFVLLYRRRREFGLDSALQECQVRVRGAPSGGFLSQYSCLLTDLDWGTFTRRCRTLALRAVLILSTYTMASITATNLGTRVIAAHQVINQLQQLQLNVTWAFLSVGQTMTANVYGGKGGAKAARVVANRVVFWGAATSAILGIVTWSLRDFLPLVFVQDPAVLAILRTAMLPACAMLAFSWNNALEGCLLGADDQGYVVGTYPWAVSAGLIVLAASYKLGYGLPGIWWSLTAYYIALVTSFGSRFVVPWNRGNL